MNNKTLDQYYQSHQEIYKSIAKTCSSAEELILTISLHGKTWTQWDWAFLIQHIGLDILMSNFPITQKIPNSKILLEDIIKTIQTNDLLDKILTNKKVLNSLIQLVNRDYDNSVLGFAIINVKILNVLAQLFKKFPELWNMNYMFKNFKGKRYHRLCTEKVTRAYNLTKDEISKMDYKQYLNKFIEIYSI
jgi:hypothetical protein